MDKRLNDFLSWGIGHHSVLVSTLTILFVLATILGVMFLFAISLYYSYGLTALLAPPYLYYRYRKETDENS